MVGDGCNMSPCVCCYKFCVCASVCRVCVYKKVVKIHVNLKISPISCNSYNLLQFLFLQLTRGHRGYNDNTKIFRYVFMKTFTKEKLIILTYMLHKCTAFVKHIILRRYASSEIVAIQYLLSEFADIRNTCFPLNRN